MFENILFQTASERLSSDIISDNLPGAVLFSGPVSSGKLSAALETARVLSCRGQNKGAWDCSCPSCLRHKAMISPNVLIVGPSTRTLEIAAAKNTFLTQNAENTSHLDAARYLYIRAVRKLLVRFSSVLWEGESSFSKIAPLVMSIEEKLEDIQPGRQLPENSELIKILDDIEKDSEKLETSYLYKTLPVNQIRNFSSWARLTSNVGKKVLIIENAEKMADASRNALLKILEEPPEDTMFILTTACKGAMMQTILSRVRNYSFTERTPEQQKNLVQRLFYYNGQVDPARGVTISEHLYSFLPCSPKIVYEQAFDFFSKIANGKVPDVAKICTACLNFSPRILFNLFLEGIIESQKKLCTSAAGAESSVKILEIIGQTYNNVFVYNQSPQSALEQLTRALMQVNYYADGIFREAVSE